MLGSLRSAGSRVSCGKKMPVSCVSGVLFSSLIHLPFSLFELY